jgi:hypothetical protein
MADGVGLLISASILLPSSLLEEGNLGGALIPPPKHQKFFDGVTEEDT